MGFHNLLPIHSPLFKCALLNHIFFILVALFKAPVICKNQRKDSVVFGLFQRKWTRPLSYDSLQVQTKS